MHWDASSGEPLDADRVAAELTGAGWTVTGTERGSTSVTVRAVDGRTATSVHLAADGARGTTASIGVSRRSLAPSLGTCVLVGALAGGIGGALIGLRRRAPGA